MERWEGKVAVVTGASSGIGSYVVEQLVRNGLKVVGLARRLELLQDMEKRLEKQTGLFYPIKCDVSNDEECVAAFKSIEKKFGAVHILINNAGVLVPETIIGTCFSIFFFLSFFLSFF